MNNIKVIVSLTSHTKERLANVPYFLFHSIFKHSYEYVKVVLTLYKEDIENIPPRLQEMIDLGLVELIIAEDNLRCHLKYFYAMKQYRDLPVITIDDDSIYPKDMIPDFLKNAKKYPNTIIARSARHIRPGKTYTQWDEIVGGVDKAVWLSDWDMVRSDLNPEGYSGIYYPPNILDIDDSMISEIREFPRADDIYLTVIEQRKGIKSIVPKYEYNKLDKCTKGYDAISTKHDNIRMIDELTFKYFKAWHE
jgi:hypothetical protein